MEIEYPKVRKESIQDNFNGQIISDPYRWMENHNDPELIEWIKKENELVDHFINLDDLEYGKKELSKLFDYKRYGLPKVRKGKFFYTKNDGLQPQSIFYMKNGKLGKEEILFDPNSLSEDGTVAVVEANFSYSGDYVAFSISVSGSDWFEVWIYDINHEKFLEEKIQNVRNSANVEWRKNGKGFFYSAYVGKDETNSAQKLWWHDLHTNQDKDKLIFEHPTDEMMGCYSVLSHDEKYIFLLLWKSTMPENMLYFKKLDSDDEFKPIVDELKNEYLILGTNGDKAIVRTNYNAENGKIIEIDLNNPKRENWHDLVKEKDYALETMEGSLVVNNHIVLIYIEDVKHSIETYDLNGKFKNKIPLPGIGSTLIDGFQDQKELFIWFGSFTDSGTIYLYDFGKNNLEAFFDEKQLIDQSLYTMKQIFYKSKDNTKIPMYIMYKNDLVIDGNCPTLLYGYGGFNISLTPTFSQRGVLWMNEGGIYAVANIRGGGEYGDKWHLAGLLSNKQNVFDDFISAGEWLIKNGYTNSKKLAILGGSNGGLLVASCMLQRPDLYGGVVCAVGVLDMLRYHKFTIGHYWVPEYGDPSNLDHFKFMIKYSPLHNIKNVNYPPILIYSADTDDRVDPAHSEKFAATLQEIGKGGPLLLRIIVRAGHGFGKPITKLIEDMAYEYAFLKKVILD